MAFATQNFSAAVAGTQGIHSTAGTFTAAITGNADGTVTGTWSYTGTFLVGGFYGGSGTVSLTGTLTGAGSGNGPWAITLQGTNVQNLGLTLSFADNRYALNGDVGFLGQYTVIAGYDIEYTYTDPFAFHASVLGPLVAPTEPVPIVGTEGADNLNGTAGNDTITALGGADTLDGLAGNDSLLGGEGRDTLTGGTGNDTINGGGGLDVAVYSDLHAAYSINGTGSNWTVTHIASGEVDTLIDVERLRFADDKVAIDLQGTGGLAYRLYQAAFNRVPDIPGLGFQMNDLDNHLTMAQVAGNFIASPEFQATYGNVDTAGFVTLLYANVLHRLPDAGGLAFHVNNIDNVGLSRADVLAQFSESPENQANVIGAIAHGMVYVFP